MIYRFVFVRVWGLVRAGSGDNMATTLTTGGARSGKSMRAEARTHECPGRPVYVATAEALDAEMSERIARHRARRGSEWLEREAPLELVAALTETDGGGARLVD